MATFNVIAAHPRRSLVDHAPHYPFASYLVLSVHGYPFG